MKRSATAIWKGSGKEGKGALTTQSAALKNMQYSSSSRFEDGDGTNPEELIAAAHAGCFAMKLSYVLQALGFTPDSLDVKGEVTLDNGVITMSALQLKAHIPGISPAQFQDAAEDARLNCPVSKLLNTKITLDASLE
jgi:osmotically inducible protein OsmC